jgi:predicted acyltransferase
MEILAVILFVAEIKGHRNWTTPFVLFGKNPLFIYILAGVWAKVFGLIRIGDSNVLHAMYVNVFQPIGGNLNGSLLFAIAHVLLFLFVGWLLDRKQIYVRV